MITYNHEKYIAQAIEGVLMQKTDFPVELVIGDDCSTDRTGAICREFFDQNPQSIRILKRDRNLGMMPNLVDVLENCRGKYIATCEGDDYWIDPEKLQKQIDFLLSNSHYAGSATNARRYYESEGRFDVDKINGDLPDEIDVGPEMIHQGRVMMYTPTLVIKNNLFDFSLLSKYSFGDEFVRLLTAFYGPMKFFNWESSVYRIHSGGAMHTLVPANPRKFFADYLDFLGFFNSYTDFEFEKDISLRSRELERLLTLSDQKTAVKDRIIAAYQHLRERPGNLTVDEIKNTISLGFPNLKKWLWKLARIAKPTR